MIILGLKILLGILAGLWFCLWRAGFRPVVIGSRSESRAALAAASGDADPTGLQALPPTDTIGVVSVHDGPSVASGEIIAPEIAPRDGLDPNYFQDPEAFLALGGRRGRQLQVLTDGTYFINRWFATVETRPKTLIPIGYVVVVVSYQGAAGTDLTGESFRYGEQVEEGLRGVWKKPLPPGKYPINPYARKIELITADGYEPTLPLSLVLHIDYEKAPRVVRRFGDVRRLISQTLDPILSAYFRDVAQNSRMLDLLTKREEIQRAATESLGRRFSEFDINCVAVLIGRPESKAGAGEDPIERLFAQLRTRRLAQEQKETFDKEEEAAVRLRELNAARAAAEKQAEMTQTRLEVEIAENRGLARLAEAKREAERTVALAEASSRARDLEGKGEAARVLQVGGAEAEIAFRKVRVLGDPRLFVFGAAARGRKRTFSRGSCRSSWPRRAGSVSVRAPRAPRPSFERRPRPRSPSE